MTSPIRFTSGCGRFQLLLGYEAIAKLKEYCTLANDRETGGILIGAYSSDLGTATVSEVTPPPEDSKAGNTWFVRGVRGLRAMLATRWKRADRRYYVGEWHYHPASTIAPSTQDFEQLKAIASSPEYDCSEPLMLIVGRPGEPQLMRAYVSPRGKDVVELDRS